MSKGSTIEKIEKEIDKLPQEDRIRLVEKLANQLRKTGLVTKKHDLHQLYGLGKGIWVNEDAQEYVDRIREDRV